MDCPNCGRPTEFAKLTGFQWENNKAIAYCEKCTPRFEIGEKVKVLLNAYTMKTKETYITHRYYMDFTFSNIGGGWYYHTPVIMGIHENLIIKRKKVGVK